MMREESVVEIDVAKLVNGFKMQDDFLVFLLKTVRQSEVFLIIQSSKRTFIAGKIGFRREGDFDVLIIEFPCTAKRKERVSF